MRRERAQVACDAAGLGGAIALSALIVWGHPQAEPPAPPPAQAQPVQLSVVEAPPSPPAPPAAEPPPPAPAPEPQPPPPVQPVQQASQPLPLPTPQRPPPMRPPPRRQTHVQRQPQPIAAAEAPASAAPAAAPAAQFDLPPSHAPARDQTADDAYVGGLHATLVRRTVPPQSAQYRLLRPHGTVDVGFTLARSGAVASVHVISSSGSPLLDAQALAIVRDGAYPPFPAAAFAGEAAHVFHIPIRFLPAGSGE